MARSIHSSDGVLLVSTQSVFGTAVTPATPLSPAEYNCTDDADFRQFYTVGSKNLHKNKAGIYKVDWQVRFSGLGSDAPLQYGIRDAVTGELDWLTFGFGVDTNGLREAWQVQDCKVESMEVSLDGGGIMTASLQGIGRQKSDLGTLVAAASGDDPLMSYESVFTLNGSPFENLSFRFTVNHNLTMETVNRGAAVADAVLRAWDYLTEGNEEISGTVRLARKHAKDFQAKCPAGDGDLVVVLTEACDPANTFTLTFDDVEFLSQARNMPQQGYGDFELPFNAKGLTIT